MKHRTSPDNSKTEKASETFGGIGRLPPVQFRGVDGELLAAQYRREQVGKQNGKLVETSLSKVKQHDMAAKPPKVR